MSACTNAYWPRSGERGSISRREELAPDERSEARLEVSQRHPDDRGQGLDGEALAEHGGVVDDAPVGLRRACRGARRSAR